MSKLKKSLMGAMILLLACPVLAAEVTDRAAEKAEILQSAAKANAEVVDCSAGERLAAALRSNAGFLRIWFIGTCTENLVIQRDDVLLRGVGVDPAVVGSIEIIGSSRVTLQGFAVLNSPANGIKAIEGSSITVDHIRVEDAAERGILAQNADAVVLDTTVLRSGSVGILARASPMNLGGAIVCNDNGFTGIAADLGASISAGSEILTGDVTLTANGNLVGVIVQIGSQMVFVNGTMHVEGNATDGILVGDSSTFVYADSIITSINNGGFGVLMGQISDWLPFTGTEALNMETVLTFTGNGAGGVAIVRSGYMEFGSTVETIIADNGGPGLLIDESRALVQGVDIADNAGPNVILLFGSAVTFGANNDLGGPILCIDSVLTRGSAGCPEMNGGASSMMSDKWSNLHLRFPGPGRL